MVFLSLDSIYQLYFFLGSILSQPNLLARIRQYLFQYAANNRDATESNIRVNHIKHKMFLLVFSSTDNFVRVVTSVRSERHLLLHLFPP